MRRSEVPVHAPTVFVVDPDPSTGAVVKDVVHGSHLRCETFSSGREFLAAFDDAWHGCLVLEQRIPDISGLQIQRRLAARGSTLPLVFVSAAVDVSTAVALMRGGAVHVLEKPPRTIELLNAIQEAVALGESRRFVERDRRRLRDRIAGLTRKERQVLTLVAQGQSIKAMAVELGLCIRAVELRRRNIMKKLGVPTTMELLRFAVAVNQELPEHTGRDRAESMELV
jgi:two-component system, LuxR family, response regulator FixJ